MRKLQTMMAVRQQNRSWVLLGLLGAQLLAAATADAQTLFPLDTGAGRTGSRPVASSTPDPIVTGHNPVFESIPVGPVTDVPLPLTLADAVARGLEHNLGLLVGRTRADEARGTRRVALSALLPRLTTRTQQSSQKVNLAAFGFTGFPGIEIPNIVGPFPVFDSRLSVSQSVYDGAAIGHARAEARQTDAARFDLDDTRGQVVLAVATLYLDAVTAHARIAAVVAQEETAMALYSLATDLKNAGMVAGIDVVRAELARDEARRRVIEAEHDLEKRKLRLARTIGLPLRQAFVLVDTMPYSALDDITLASALEEAYASRSDYRAAQARLEAAKASRRAAVSERLPRVELGGHVGYLGSSASDGHTTYLVAGSVEIPVFEGGRISGRVAERDAQQRRRQAEVEAFRGRIEYEVRVALLDLDSARSQLGLAERAVVLAEQELAQARNRFAAGVTSNIEVVEAQEAVAAAAERRIASLYAHNVAKAGLAHALGTAETRLTRFLGESR